MPSVRACPVRQQTLRVGVPLLIILAVMIGRAGIADELQDYAEECHRATGTTVPDFDCDHGQEVPGQGSVFSGPRTGRSETCDAPNRLNKQCDPGSKFQVLTRTDDAYVVAHCRHENGGSGMYGDVAVIQHNRKNGATCFYQIIGDQLHGDVAAGSSAYIPPGSTAPSPEPTPVKSPSNGLPPKTFWLSPSATVALDHCGGYYDNGPLIRSPYINGVQGLNEIPGARDFQFNSMGQVTLLFSWPSLLLHGRRTRSRLRAMNATAVIVWLSII